jgi:hypothetical protein
MLVVRLRLGAQEGVRARYVVERRRGMGWEHQRTIEIGGSEALRTLLIEDTERVIIEPVVEVGVVEDRRQMANTAVGLPNRVARPVERITPIGLEASEPILDET